MDELRLEQEQPKRTEVEFGKKSKKRQGIIELLLAKYTKKWTIIDGKLELADGRLVTPRELLEEVKRQIRLNAAMYRQEAVVDECSVTEENACGLRACIGGWIELLAQGLDAGQLHFEEVNKFLTGSETWPWLFDASWDGYGYEKDKLAREYDNATTPAGRAEAGCKAIDLFIKENNLT